MYDDDGLDQAARIIKAIQQHMDFSACARGYDNLLAAISYQGDKNPTFAAEADAFFGWRSDVWSACYAHLEQVELGNAPMPSVEEALEMIPAFDPPLT